MDGLVRQLFAVLGGSEGKITVNTHKTAILAAIGNLTNAPVSGKEFLLCHLLHLSLVLLLKHLYNRPLPSYPLFYHPHGALYTCPPQLQHMVQHLQDLSFYYSILIPVSYLQRLWHVQRVCAGDRAIRQVSRDGGS